MESLKKYQERKQQKQTHVYAYGQVRTPPAGALGLRLPLWLSCGPPFSFPPDIYSSSIPSLPRVQPQVSGHPTVVTFDPELIRKEDIVEEQIDFSSARKQFLQGEATKRDVPPQIYSAKPFSKSRVGGDGEDSGEGHVTWTDKSLAGEFTCARAVMTILSEEDDRKSHFHPSFHLEESDSGLDELSVRSQDTTVFSLDSVSDSGASLPLTPVSPPTPQPTTPINGQTNGSPTEDELEYHAGILVQNAIQTALAAHSEDQWQPAETTPPQLRSPVSPSSASPSSPAPVSSSPVCPAGAPSLQSPASSASPAPSSPSPQPERRPQVRIVTPDETSGSQPSGPVETPSPQPISPPQRSKNGGPRIKIQSSYARALASSAPAPAAPAVASAPAPRPAPVYRPPSPPSPDKPEFSYFSKYSEAAELRSTASASRAPEAEPASGPFRLRSKKQRTLSMIEEEIRAAQQREEELKKQRKELPPAAARPGHAPGQARTGARATTMCPADKMKSNSLPARLSLTAPGQSNRFTPKRDLRCFSPCV